MAGHDGLGYQDNAEFENGFIVLCIVLTVGPVTHSKLS